MKYIAFIMFFVVCAFSNGVWNKKVYSFGNLPEVLNNSGMGDTISLINLKKISSLYAVGLLDKLQGEILVFDSKAYISSMTQHGSIHIDKTLQKQASFLLYSEVPSWIEIKLPKIIYNKQQFVEYLEDQAKENGISTFQAFPFILEGKIKANNYRVLSYKQDDIVKGYGGTCACDLSEDQKTKVKMKYKSLSLYDTMLHTSVTLLGFYSPQRGIITDEYSYTYINFITHDRSIAGHSTKLMIGEDMVLKLPKVH